MSVEPSERPRRTVSKPEAGPPGRGRRELLADRAYIQLRDRIITLQIPPGAPIGEDRLGEELAMGRTPVREAVKRLALENLVTVFPRRGTFASDINITDLTHICDVRTVLDLFSGTARVGHALKARGYRVHANDHNAYAAALATCYVAADRTRWGVRAERLIAELDQLPGST